MHVRESFPDGNPRVFDEACQQHKPMLQPQPYSFVLAGDEFFIYLGLRNIISVSHSHQDSEANSRLNHLLARGGQPGLKKRPGVG